MPRKNRIKSDSLDDLNEKELLQDRLEWEGFSVKTMKSDGNCQFRALADQIYQSSDSHKSVRQEIVNQLKSHPQWYKGFVNGMDYSEYVKNMSQNSVWGDEVTLKAAADLYGVQIQLITSFKDNPSTLILPKSSCRNQPQKIIYLSYLSGIHYNSIHLNTDNTCGSSEDQRTRRRRRIRRTRRTRRWIVIPHEYHKNA